jgi:hypothetical protein
MKPSLCYSLAYSRSLIIASLSSLSALALSLSFALYCFSSKSSIDRNTRIWVLWSPLRQF